MKVGDIVVPAHPGVQLHSGAEHYPSAVVGCLEPFVLVSAASDMCWSTLSPQDFKVVSAAPPDAINAIQRRINPEFQVRAPYGESFLGVRLGCGLTLTALDFGLERKSLAVDLNKKVLTWPTMGGWSQAIAKEDNPSYGWLFGYSAEENLWHCERRLSEMQLKRVEERAAQHKVQVSQRMDASTEYVVLDSDGLLRL